MAKRVTFHLGTSSTVRILSTEEIDRTLSYVVDNLTRLYGGATILQGQGRYTEEGFTVAEQTYVIYSIITVESLVTVDTAELERIAEKARDTLSQSSVLVTVEEIAYAEFI